MIVPYYKGENIKFDVKPETMEFTVNHSHLQLSKQFQVSYLYYLQKVYTQVAFFIKGFFFHTQNQPTLKKMGLVKGYIFRGLYFTSEIYKFPPPLPRFYKLPPSTRFRNRLMQFFACGGGNLMNWGVKIKYTPLMAFLLLFIFFFTFY